MSVTNPDDKDSGMTEYERRMLAIEEAKLARGERRQTTLIAYLLWLFLGLIMVHRMYLGHFKGVALWIVIFICGIFMPLIWIACLVRWIVDLFSIPEMVENQYRQDSNY